MSQDFIQIEVHEKSNRWRNTFRCTPPPKYRNLIQALASAQEEKAGTIVNTIIRQYFDNMPTDQRLRLLHKSKNHY